MADNGVASLEEARQTIHRLRGALRRADQVLAGVDVEGTIAFGADLVPTDEPSDDFEDVLDDLVDVIKGAAAKYPDADIEVTVVARRGEDEQETNHA